MKVLIMKISIHVEKIIVLNHCDWIRTEENIDISPPLPKPPKNHVFKIELNFLEFMRALQSARKYRFIENENFKVCRVYYHFESL